MKIYAYEVRQDEMDYFKEYLIIGGMPQAVEMYSKTRDFEKVDTIEQNKNFVQSSGGKNRFRRL